MKKKCNRTVQRRDRQYYREWEIREDSGIHLIYKLYATINRVLARAKTDSKQCPGENVLIN